jgi:hypothetical protein
MSISTMMCLLLLAATASGQTPPPGVSKEPADTPSYTISGYVIDADTGEPVVGASEHIAYGSLSSLTETLNQTRCRGKVRVLRPIQSR